MFCVNWYLEGIEKGKAFPVCLKSLKTNQNTEAFPMNQFNKDIIAALSSDKDITLNEVLRRQIEVAAN